MPPACSRTVTGYWRKETSVLKYFGNTSEPLLATRSIFLDSLPTVAHISVMPAARAVSITFAGPIFSASAKNGTLSDMTVTSSKVHHLPSPDLHFGEETAPSPAFFTGFLAVRPLAGNCCGESPFQYESML